MLQPVPPPALARTAVAALLAVLLSPLAAVLTATPASAESGYRFWGMFSLSGTKWVAAQVGPAQEVLKDGAVSGWRFGVSGLDPRAPRAVLTFEQICATTPAQADRKRIGVLVDYGRAADAGEAGAAVPAPKATCVVVAAKATTAVVLAAAATVRTGSGAMICGLDGYPATGCGDPVASIPAAAAAADVPLTNSVAVVAPGSAPTLAGDPGVEAYSPETASASASSGSAAASATSAASTASAGANGTVSAGGTVAAAPAATADGGTNLGLIAGIVIALAAVGAAALSVSRRRNAH